MLRGGEKTRDLVLCWANRENHNPRIESILLCLGLVGFSSGPFAFGLQTFKGVFFCFCWGWGVVY